MLSIEFLRQFRFSGYAIFDLAVSFLGIYLLSPLLTKVFSKIRINIPKKNWLFLTLPISILVHLLVGEMTLMTRNFINLNGSYGLKILILGLIILGVRGIKVIKKQIK